MIAVERQVAIKEINEQLVFLRTQRNTLKDELETLIQPQIDLLVQNGDIAGLEELEKSVSGHSQLQREIALEILFLNDGM